MEPLAILLGVATLLPLASFVIILTLGPRLGSAFGHGAYVATGAILGACLLSFVSFGIWITRHHPPDVHHAHHDADHGGHGEQGHGEQGHGEQGHGEQGHEAEHGAEHHDSALLRDSQGTTLTGAILRGQSPDHGSGKPHVSGDYYLLGKFGRLRMSISYYIDTLTVCMFCMVTLIASCIHFYAMGYMHDELHEVTDHEVHLRSGEHLSRPGRYWRFFQYMSLFCFSMLGLVLAGNIAMVFVFWELVGICSYFLIGFYVERTSASNAANKAFIVNRVGDFGMIIGLMALWTGLGTFSFGDTQVKDQQGQVVATEAGLFTQVTRRGGKVLVPDGMVRLAAREAYEKVRVDVGPYSTRDPQAVRVHEAQVQRRVAALMPGWRQEFGNQGYWIMIIAGLGIFCGCVGKSAQFPLHVWLPDAMEGPTPVSALVHSATMVAAGVYLVARFYPVFVPEVLLVIAIIGCITLFMAATIAITATDIKRVLAYSTISQLGYMMLALGVGGWVAGVMHLITHAFFKSLLFLCSGSVIHAVHSNEMTEMGGLRKKMPITAYTMLIGCLAISGASIPWVIGFSGYYSKDAILEQAYSFMSANNSFWGGLFFFSAAGGAAITAFYMFRMWFMTFAGKPRNQHRYDHAHESPKVMYVPLIVLAVFATSVAWTPIAPWQSLKDSLHDGGWFPYWNLALPNLLEQARPDGTLPTVLGHYAQGMTWPSEELSHVPEIKNLVTGAAFCTALGGIGLATVMYVLGLLDPDEVRRQFRLIYAFLRNKWYFDELYEILFVRPTHVISAWISWFDRQVIDRVIDGLAWITRAFSVVFERLADRTIVDGSVDLFASCTYAVGVWLKRLQTGHIRQYVLFIVIGAVVLFVLISFVWNPALGP